MLNIPPGIPLQLRSDTVVYRHECVYSFDTPLSCPTGLDVDLVSYRAYARGGTDYTSENYIRGGSEWYLNIKKTFKPVIEAPDGPVPKMKCLEIVGETDSHQDRYETVLSVYNAQTHQVWSIDELGPEFQELILQIATAESSDRREAIELWQYEISECTHSILIEQSPINVVPSLQKCQRCNLEENLWICLNCGCFGCGRKQFGLNVDGNSHALSHFEETGHEVAVKLKSLSADQPELCDAYCYKCETEVRVSKLKRLLETFGINLEDAVKTEKTVTELNIEQNLKWEFKLDGSNGERLEPVYGPGLTGLKNLGNSCYMNAVLQLLFSTMPYQEFFGAIDIYSQQGDPSLNLAVQLAKVRHGLLSGVYSYPDPLQIDSYQLGIRPTVIKKLIAATHPEFAGPRQQDASEYIGYFMDRLDQEFGLHINRSFQLLIADILAVGEGSVESGSVTYMLLDNLSLSIPEELNILSNIKVQGTQSGNNDNKLYTEAIDKYVDKEVDGYDLHKHPDHHDKAKAETPKKVTFADCLHSWIQPLIIPDYIDNLGNVRPAKKQTGLILLPPLLLVGLERIKLANCMTVKISRAVDIPYKLDVSQCIIHPASTLTENTVGGLPSFVANEEALAALEAMGFPKQRCVRALYYTENKSADDAMTWILAHMDDADVDTEFKVPHTDSIVVDAGSIEILQGMGFDAQCATSALKKCDNNVQAAVEWLFAHPDGLDDTTPAPINLDTMRKTMISELRHQKNLNPQYKLRAVICHKGLSPHTGHYVVYIRKNINGHEKWILFNDEKVVVCDESSLTEIETTGYVYLFEQETE